MLTPYPWQVADAHTLATHPRWLLANEMRTGKTGSAILGAVECGALRIGVACPAIVTREWAKQLEDFEPRRNAVWTIESYDKVVRRGVGILGDGLDLLILDEAHYLKSPEAKRTVAFYGDNKGDRGMLHVPRIWALSGTFAPNHAGEYYTHLRAFGLTKYTYWTFLNRYCIVVPTTFGYRVQGNRRETLPELRAMLATLVSRRSQASVWKETPEPFWSVRAMTPTPADAKALQAIERPAQGKDLAAMSEASTSAMRRELGVMKVPYVVDHVLDLLVQNQVPKVLIGVWHTDVLDALRLALAAFHPICINGSTSENARWELKERFQTAPTCRVAIVQMKAGGIGISLSAACHVVLAEPDWGRDINEQFVQRPQHIARTVPLPVDLMALAGSLDEAILRSNTRKRRMDHEITLDPSGSAGAGDVPSMDSLLGVTDHGPIFIADL